MRDSYCSSAAEKSGQWSLLDQLAGSSSKEVCRLCRKVSLTGALPFVELFARTHKRWHDKYGANGRSHRAFSDTANQRTAKSEMNIEFTRSFLLWCTVINYGILLVWFLVFVIAHDWMRRFHGRWFRLSDEQFDFLHYLGMSIYKIGILLFNLVPLVVLWIVS